MTSSYHNLTATKTELLTHYLRHGSRANSSASDIVPHRGTTEVTPIALIQEPLWWRAQTAGIPPLYNESITIHRSGALDVIAVRESLTEIVRRHEAWRTTFRAIAGQPYQVVRPAPREFPLLIIDLRETPGADAEWSRIAMDEVSRPFDMEAGPLIRAILASFSDREHHLLIAAHQIVVDGLSVYDVFPAELATLYEAFVAKEPSPLPVLPAQYSDFCAWHRARIKGTIADDELNYWGQHLASMPPPLPWPNARQKVPLQTYRGLIHPFSLPKPLLDKLNGIRKITGVSLFAVLIAAFAALLRLYTGHNDIIIGTPANTGRDRSEFQPLLGYFLNPVAIRVTMRENLRFVDHLLQSQNNISDALSHSNLPLEYVAERLGLMPHRDGVQIGLSLAPSLPALRDGWSMTPMDVGSGGARWDLYLVFSEGTTGMIGRAQYNPDLFEIETIVTLIQDLTQLLEAVADDPRLHLSEWTHTQATGIRTEA